MSEYLLELKNVTKVYKGGTVALDNISYAIDSSRPSIVSIAGESGSGKTTMGMAVLGFLVPTAGKVLYRGADVHAFNKRQMKQYRREVQAVFQDPFAAYNPFYKVDHIMKVPIANYKLASNKREAREMMEQALTAVGLRPEETLGRFPHQLSGGQRQRMVVARALLLQPQLLVADEPVSMVDASLRATILESINKLNTELGITILYITHDLTTAYHVSEYIMIMYRGSVMEAGEVDPIILNPQHPYTQLLIDSIPWPDLTRTWGQHEIISTDEDISQESIRGCKFAGRCPHVMDICKHSPPPLYMVNEDRVAACYLYDSNEVLPAEDLGKLLHKKKVDEPTKNGSDPSASD